MRCDIKAINGYRRCMLVMIHDARRVLGEARERLVTAYKNQDQINGI